MEVKIEGTMVPMGEELSQRVEDSRDKLITYRNNLIMAFKEDMIKTLEDRREACLRHLYKAVENGIAVAVPDCPGLVVYNYQDGHPGSFHAGSYEEMNKAILLLKEDKFEEVLNTSWMLDQILKGFLNQASTPTIKHINGIEYPWSAMVSLLMEYFHFSLNRNED